MVSGKGQFECGNKKCCSREGLRSYEVNFAYEEAGESKQALVKLRVCPKCSYKLNYRKEKELERELRKESRRKKRRKKQEKKGRSSSKRDKLLSTPEDEDSDDSGSSEDVEDSRFKRSVSKKTSENKEGEFEPYFKDMFL